MSKIDFDVALAQFSDGEYIRKPSLYIHLKAACRVIGQNGVWLASDKNNEIYYAIAQIRNSDDWWITSNENNFYVLRAEIGPFPSPEAAYTALRMML